MFLSWHRDHRLSLRILGQHRLRLCLNHQQPNSPLGPNLQLQLYLCLRLPPLHPKRLVLHPQRQSLRPVLPLRRLFKEDVRLLCLNGLLRPHQHLQRYPRKPLPPPVRLNPPCRLRARNRRRERAFLRQQLQLPFVRVRALSSISIMQISMK